MRDTPRKDLRIAVEDEEGQRYVFDHKAMEDSHDYRLHLQVAFQVPNRVVEEGIPYCNERGIRGAYVVEITTANRHLFPDRFMIEGTAGKLIVPPKAPKGDRQMGAHHEIHIPRSLNAKYPTIRYWLKNTFTNEMQLEEGDKVWFTTLTTGFKNRLPAIDSIVVDFDSKEKDVRWATDTRLQEKLQSELGVRLELGLTVGSSLLPGFPSRLEDTISLSSSPDLIGQMIGQAKAFHSRGQDPEDPENFHSTGLRRINRAEQQTPLAVLINPLNFKSIKRESWPRLIDNFFLGKHRTMVEKFYLITGLHEATTESNFYTVNDFNQRFAKDVTNRLSDAIIVDHTVFGRAEGKLSGGTEIIFRDYGDSPKVGLLVFEETARSHTFCGEVSLISTGRLGEEAEVSSINQEHFQEDSVITISYPTDREGSKQREALAYLRGLGIASVPKRGAPVGWEQRQVRCDDSEDALSTLSTLLAPPSAGENPLLAMIDGVFADGSTKISFDSRHGDIFHLFCSFTGPIPTVPIGEGSFVCDTGELDLDVLARNCLHFNTHNQSVVTQFLSITHKDRTRWIKAPKIPEHMLHLGMEGPGYLVVAGVPISIRQELVTSVIREVYSGFAPTKTACDFVELPDRRGLGIKFWVPDKARADDLQLTFCHRTMKVLDGDLMATSLVQPVFREEARGQKRRLSDFMGTPTPKNRLEARAIGSRLLGEGFAMSTAVNRLLEGFQAVELAGARHARPAPVSPALPAAGPPSSVAPGRAPSSPLQEPASQELNKAQKKRRAQKQARADKEAKEALAAVEEEEESEGSGKDGSGSDQNPTGSALLPDRDGMDQKSDDEGDSEDSDAVQEERKRCDSPVPVEDGDAEPDLPDTTGPDAGKKNKKNKVGKGKVDKRVSTCSPANTRSQTAVRVSPWRR